MGRTQRFECNRDMSGLYLHVAGGMHDLLDESVPPRLPFGPFPTRGKLDPTQQPSATPPPRCR